MVGSSSTTRIVWASAIGPSYAGSRRCRPSRVSRAFRRIAPVRCAPWSTSIASTPAAATSARRASATAPACSKSDVRDRGVRDRRRARRSARRRAHARSARAISTPGSAASRTTSSTSAPISRCPSSERDARVRARAHAAARRAPSRSRWLEERCDEVNDGLEPLRSFVLSGGTPAAAQLHLARTVARRAERVMVRAGRHASRSTRRRSPTSTGSPTCSSSSPAQPTRRTARCCGCPAASAEGAARASGGREAREQAIARLRDALLAPRRALARDVVLGRAAERDHERARERAVGLRVVVDARPQRAEAARLDALLREAGLPGELRDRDVDVVVDLVGRELLALRAGRRAVVLDREAELVGRGEQVVALVEPEADLVDGLVERDAAVEAALVEVLRVAEA